MKAHTRQPGVRFLPNRLLCGLSSTLLFELLKFLNRLLYKSMHHKECDYTLSKSCKKQRTKFGTLLLFDRGFQALN